MENRPSYDELREQLHEAGQIASVLRNEQVDAILSKDHVLLFEKLQRKLRRVEDLAERQLREITSIYEAAPLGLGVLDRDLRFLRMNRRLAERYGLRTGEQAGNVLSKVVPDIAEDIELQLKQVIETGAPLTIEAVEKDHPSGELRSWRDHYFPLYDEKDQITGICSVAEETTEGKKIEAELRMLNETLESRIRERTLELSNLNAELEQRSQQLESLMAELVETEDRERKRLAEILHNDLQQLLVGMRLRLGEVRARTEGEEQLGESLKSIDGILGKCIKTSRDLSHDLSLTGFGDNLHATLQRLAEQSRVRYGLEVRLDREEGTETCPRNWQIFLHDAIRELLFNIVKHAKVSTAEITLRRTGASTELCVRDYGQGFDSAILERKDPAAGGIGLFKIKERTVLLGGHLKIGSAPGQGSSFIFTIPCGKGALESSRESAESEA